MLSSKWHGHYSFTLDWSIQKLFIVLLPQEEIHTESGLSSRTWAQRDCVLYLWTWVCVAEWGKDCLWLSLRHKQETSAEQKESLSRLCRPTLILPGIKTRAQSLLSLCARDHLWIFIFHPQKTHEKWINLFWVCLIFSLNAYSSFLILRSVYFIVFVEGKNVAIFFSLYLMFYSVDTWNVIGPSAAPSAEPCLVRVTSLFQGEPHSCAPMTHAKLNSCKSHKPFLQKQVQGDAWYHLSQGQMGCPGERG